MARIDGFTPAAAGFRLAARLVALAAAVPCGTAAAAEPADVESGPSAESVRRKVRELLWAAESETTSDSSGSTRIDGNGILGYAERSVLKDFLSDVRGRVEAALPSFCPGASPVLCVSVFTNAACADGAPAFVRPPVFRRAAGRDGARTDIALAVENPGNGLDARKLAERAVDGLLGAAVAAAAPGGPPAAAANRPPPWFAAGLARTFDVAARQTDYDSTRASWSHASLPPVSALVSADSPFPSADPALAAELVSWWLSFPGKKERWAEMRGRLAAGEAWGPALFFATGPGGDAQAADRDWDSWLVARRRLVLSPGTTTRAHVVRALAAMNLVPGADGVPADLGGGPRPLADIFGPSASSWAQAAAAAKLETLARLSAGRGDGFRAAAGTLSGLLAPVAAGRRAPDGAAETARAALAALAGSADAD